MTSQKHTYKQWQQFMRMSYEDKLLWSQQLILMALKKNNTPSISLSWGKDSIVMLHLIRKFCKNTYVIFANTEMEYPETYKYRDKMLKTDFKDMKYIETKPIKSFWDCVKEYGYPHKRNPDQNKTSKRTPKCCIFLKERPLRNKQKELSVDLVFIGLQTTESMNRRRLFMRLGSYYYKKTDDINICLPLTIWTDADVNRYINDNDIILNPLYDIMKRTGCMACTGFTTWREVMNKYNPRLYRFILKDKENQITIQECFKTLT